MVKAARLQDTDDRGPFTFSFIRPFLPRLPMTPNSRLQVTLFSPTPCFPLRRQRGPHHLVPFPLFLAPCRPGVLDLSPLPSDPEQAKKRCSLYDVPAGTRPQGKSKAQCRRHGPSRVGALETHVEGQIQQGPCAMGVVLNLLDGRARFAEGRVYAMAREEPGVARLHRPPLC